MIVNRGSYQISQMTGEDRLKIFRDGQLLKELPARPDLKYEELVKVLELYTHRKEVE